MQKHHAKIVLSFSALVLGVALIVISYTSSAHSAHASQPLSTTRMTQVASAKKAANPCNPCAAKGNPCAVRGNPCAAQNPCNPCGAGGQVDPKLITRPAGIKPYKGDTAALLKDGERLWNDRALGTSGLACGTCHLNHGNFNPSFTTPYPHPVAMPQQMAGVAQVSLEEMVQFCMVKPMAAKPFAWDARELAALTAYAHQAQKGFIQAAAANPDLLKPRAANPCNPCGAGNPCNPCAAKNPCAGKNPCAAKNPCAQKK